MKIKKLAALCKSEETIVVKSKGNYQWIGTGLAMFPVYNLPILTQSEICAMFDFSKNLSEDINYRFVENTEINFDDTCECENRLEPLITSVNWLGETYKMYITSKGVAFLKESLLAPINDEGDLEIYERFNGRNIYFAVKRGLLIVGLIMPVYLNEKFNDELQQISRIYANQIGSADGESNESTI